MLAVQWLEVGGWTLLITFWISSFVLGAVSFGTRGYLRVLGITDWTDAFVVFVIVVAIGLSLAPLLALGAIGIWVYEHYSPAGHLACGALKKALNPRLEQDRLDRRLKASRAKAAQRAAHANPSADSTARE